MWSKDVPADRVIKAWLANIRNGIKQYRKVYSSFMKSAGKITINISQQEIIKESPAEIYFRLLTSQNSVGALWGKHRSCDLHSLRLTN